jgi:predicted deacylase
MKEDFSIGKITAKPGEIAKGFLPTVGLDMPDGTGNYWPIPIIIINGVEKGPVFEVDGAIHANEQIGTLTVLELVKRLDPEKIKGTFVGVPVLNPHAFAYNERGYIHDGDNKNMNRVFPGEAHSPSVTSRAVHTFWNEVILKCDYTVNLHGTNQAQVPRVVFSEHTCFMAERTFKMAKAVAYDTKWIIASESEHTKLEERTINWACAQINKPNIFLEYGPMSYMPWDLKEPLETSVKGIINCMKWAGMLEGDHIVPEYWRKTPYYTHVRCRNSGIRRDKPCLKLDNFVKEGEILVSIEDFLGNKLEDVPAPHDGIVLSIPQTRPSVGIAGGFTMIAKTPKIIKS